MKLILITLLFVLALHCAAQLNDQFLDANFSQNPTWKGDDSLFQVNASFQLQSKATVSKDIYLATESAAPNGEWSFWCRFNLSPSTANFMRFYLMSDSANLKGALNGYYVQLGGVTGNTDSITLYKQKGNSRTRIVGGRPATVSKTTNSVGIKVQRDANGNWQLFSDTLGGKNFLLEGVGSDNEFTASNYAGILVRLTNTNIQNYFLDDVYIGPIRIDTSPPVLDSIQVISATQLRLVFSENLADVTALDASNYTINNGVGGPVSAQFEGIKKNTVLLELNTPLVNNSYILTATNVVDELGNLAVSQQQSFSYFVFNAQEGDIVISEFFPDPTPAVGLPEEEFIELYNNTNTAVQLQSWTITDGTSTAVLPNIILGVDSFLVVCSTANMSLFTTFGKVAGVASLPSLNNAADQIVLKDQKGKIIHQVKYDLSWYQDVTKKDGGYTVEMDNPKQLCKGKQNFAASSNITGGTIGNINSRWNKLRDSLAPVIVDVSAINAKSVSVIFNERMDSVSLLQSTISFNPSYSMTSRNLSRGFFDTLFIQLNNNLLTNSIVTISVSNVKDCSDNIINGNTTIPFTYVVPDVAKQYNIVINEIMADPDPVIGLPNAEYIELYNASTNIISLKNWTLEDPTSSSLLPGVVLLPDSFVVLTSLANAALFAAYQNVVGVNNFPSLGNDGDQLTLKNEDGKVIHSVNYSYTWHTDNMKRNGGWSLEMIDPKNPCAGSTNWTSSVNKNGGTIAKINSVKGINKDRTSPKLKRVYPLSPTKLTVYFDESMDSLSLLPVQHYAVSPTVGNIFDIQFYDNSFQTATLLFNDSIHLKTIYRLLIDSVKDCAGNVISTDDYADFGLPEQMDSFDIAINEVLFNPPVNGSDFVELINRSDKILDLKNVLIGNTNPDNSIKDFYPIAAEGFIVFPQQYIVLSAEPFAVLSNYFTPQTKQLIQCKLPSMNDDEGSCVLLDIQQKRFDQLNYTDKMHFPLLDDKDGVSLERIDFNRPTSDKTNWTSASATSGFATPTYQNSQYAKAGESETLLSIHPEVFSPDGDGYNDIVTFSYNLAESGFTGNVLIYNSAGILIKQLLRNELLGTTGSFSWDGITDNGEKGTIGIYVCYFEAFNLKGEVLKQKSTLVLGAKL